MTTTAPTPQKSQRSQRAVAFAALFRPVLDLSPEAKILLVVLSILSLWGVAILTFGVPALVWPMKLVVPAIVVGLIMITLGK